MGNEIKSSKLVTGPAKTGGICGGKRDSKVLTNISKGPLLGVDPGLTSSFLLHLETLSKRLTLSSLKVRISSPKASVGYFFNAHWYL